MKILVDENVRGQLSSLKAAQDLRSKAQGQIDYFNNIKKFKSLKGKADIAQFLASPISYFKNLVQKELNPNPKIPADVASICKLYGIDFEEVKRNLHIGLSDHNEVLTLTDKGVTITTETENRIKEESKIYLTDPAEIKAYEEHMKLLDQLKKFFAENGTIDLRVNRMKDTLMFKIKGIYPTKYELVPELHFIKNRAKTIA